MDLNVNAKGIDEPMQESNNNEPHPFSFFNGRPE